MEGANITERAYILLRKDIISCKLPPCSMLKISAIQKDLTLSQAAVREALSRLAAEGFVQIERNRGFRVSPVSADGYRDLTTALLTLELPAVRESVLKGNTEWELNLVGVYHRALRTLELVVAGKEKLDAYWDERLHFYDALLGACENSWLLWSWRLLYAQNIRYRHMYLPLAKFELELNPHHQSVMDAVLARDVDKVAELCIENYDMVSRFIEQRLVEEGAVAVPSGQVL